MNVIMFCSGEVSKLPRTEKKHLKAEVKKSIMELYKKKPIKNLKKIALNSQWAIYTEEDMERSSIELLFPNKIFSTTNYFIGIVESNKKKFFYLIDIDELFYAKEYVIWPNTNKKRIIITN